MRRLQSIFKKADQTLKVWESRDKLRGEVYDKDGNLTMAADFFYNDGDTDEYRVREYFGFTGSYRVPFERRNGRIILYPVNKVHRIIWSNEQYEEWCDSMKDEITEEEMTYEYYAHCCEIDLDDERANLNVKVDGYIVAFAKLGLWYGTANGIKLVGTNVKDILSTSDDYATWYCDPYNVKCDSVHHDGRNYILYRVADSKEKAEKLIDKVVYGGMDEERFRRATKSLRPYIADVYGW